MSNRDTLAGALGILLRVVQGGLVAVALILFVGAFLGGMNVLQAAVIGIFVLVLLALVGILEIPVRAIRRSVGSDG